MIIPGRDGVIKVGGQAVGHIDSWSLNRNGGTAEISSIGSKDKTFEATATDWSGSASGTLDTDDAGQTAFETAFEAGTAVELSFKIASDKARTGSAFITAINDNASHGDKIAISFNFQGTGPLTTGPIGA